MAYRIFLSAPPLVVALICCLVASVPGVRIRGPTSKTQVRPAGQAGTRGEDAGSHAARILALFGLTGDGKSSLCNWLTGESNACKVGDGLESETSEVTFATRPWFGDGQENLIVADTPGISDTQNRDAKQWLATVAVLKKKLKALDVVVLVVNAQQARMKEDRKKLLAVLRDSFGTDVWSHFCVVFTHHPWKVNGNRIGFTPAQFEKVAADWREYFKQFELAREEAGWRGESRKLIEAEIDAIPFFGVELDPDMDIVSAANPLANGLIDDDGLPGILGLPQLLKLKNWLGDKNDALDLANLHPRMGPSEVAPQQQFTCLMPRPCALAIRGKRLSDRDHIQVTPWTSTCGAASAEKQRAPVEFPIKRSELGGNDSVQIFHLGATRMGKGKFRLCYCEYGNCDVSQRFSQDAGSVTLGLVSCEVEGCAMNVTEIKVSSGAPWLPCESEAKHRVKFGESAFYKCEYGHTVGGRRGEETFAQECLSTGDLVPAPQVCERTRCGYAAPVLHARAGSTAVLDFGDIVEYTCETGYSLSGGILEDGSLQSFSRRCGGDGNFSGNESIVEKGCRKWEVGEWSHCTTECGQGNRSRDVFCTTGEDADCDADFKPNTIGVCESYSGCDGCANRVDCQMITVNEMLERVGSPLAINMLLPTVSTGMLSPVTSCVCTDQCWMKNQRLIEIGKTSRSLPLNETIHNSCFYDGVSKQCGCANELSRNGNIWRVVGSGLCADKAGQNLKGGYAMRPTFNEHGLQIGPAPTFATCKKACIEDASCPGIWFGDQSSWYPVVGKVQTDAECFVYSSAPAARKNASKAALSKMYSVKIYGGTSKAIAKSSGVDTARLQQKSIMNGIKNVARWAHEDILGNSMNEATRGASGHCYKLLRE